MKTRWMNRRWYNLLSKEVTSWAKMYYYTSIGLKAPNSFSLSDEVIKETYQSQFIKPVSVFLTGDESGTISDKDIASFMSSIRGIKIYGVFHLLNYLVENSYLTRCGSTEKSLKKCTEKFSQDATECYGIVNGGKPFKCFRNDEGEILGSYGTPVLLLADTKYFSNGLNLNTLVSQSPTRLNDYSVQVLRNAVYGGIIEEGDLLLEKYIVPVDGKFEEKYITAITPELPSYYVRELISTLPEAFIKDKGNPYTAALEYAEQHQKDYPIALKELRKIFSKITVVEEPPKEKPMELNDDIVLKYISDKYGASVEELREKLMVPTVKKLYTSPYLLNEESEKMSASEFIAYAAENPMSVSGTLDDILEAFCKEENFDKEDTVDNLIKFINDEPLLKRDIKETVSDFISNNNIPAEMSLSEFITGKTSTKSNEEKAVLTLEQTQLFDELFIRVIKKVLAERKAVEFPTTESVVSRLKVPDKLREEIVKSLRTGSPIELPATEIDKATVVDYLIKKGISRVQAGKIANGEVEHRDGIISFLVGAGLSKDDAVNAVDNNKISGKQLLQFTIEEEEKKVLYEHLQSEFGKKADYELDDASFKACMSLLYNMRNTIVNNDSMEFRMSALPIIYSFIRLMMINPESVSDAIEYLEGQKAECTGDAVSYVDEAINIFEEYKG